MCQEYPSEKEIMQVVNRFQYNHFWLRDSAFHARMYTIWGHFDSAKKLLRYFLGFQNEEGNFISQKGQLDGFGQALWAFGEYIKTTGDKDFAREILPAVRKAVNWFETATSNDKFRLMPPTFALDNEWIVGRYTGHNIWALAGLDGAISVALMAGAKEDAKRFEQVKEKFYQNFYELLFEASKKNHWIIPPGMDVPGGVDWGNLLISYPYEILPASHPLVVRTIDHYRKYHYAEGIATYRNSMHHYITERVIETLLLQGRQREVLEDFYSLLLHTGSCHQGFEWAIFPWSDRDYCLEIPGYRLCNFPPHGWYAALYNTLLRNMLIREQGDDLHLFSAISPQWVKAGDEIIIQNAPTYYGKINIYAKAEKGRLKITITPRFRQLPDKIIIHLPFFAEVKKVLVNGRKAEILPDKILLKPRAQNVEIIWELKPVPDLSYQAFVERYKKEYVQKYRAQYN